METVKYWLYDSLFQAAVISPLASLIMGAFAGWLFTRTSHSEETPHQRRVVIVERVIERKYSGKTASNDDGGGLMLVSVVMSFGATWLFAAYINEISMWSEIAIISVASLITGFFLAVFIRHGFYKEWAVEVLLAWGLLILSWWLIHIPSQIVTPEVSRLAITLSPVEFWMSLTPWGKKVIPMQAFGMLILSVAVLSTFLRSFHILFLAMANPDNLDGLTTKISLMTSKFGGVSWLFFTTFLFFISWMLLSETKQPNSLFWRLFVWN
ncbi:hypothetical protein [Azospirillum doebereinerae]